MWVNCLTHTVTHTRGKSRRAPERKLSPFRCSACLWDLSDLCHEAAHFLRGLLLHLSCGVGVGAEGEARVVVPEHTADGFDVHPVLECQGRERMTQVVEPDMLQPRVLENPLVECYHRVGVVHSSCSAGWEHPRIVGCLACSCFSSSTASCGMDTSRMELPVLGRLSLRYSDPSNARLRVCGCCPRRWRAFLP